MERLLDQLGGFSRYQYRLIVMMCALSPAIIEPLFITYFTLFNPPWMCMFNSTVCKIPGPVMFGHPNYTARCMIPRKDWVFATKDITASAVTQFDIYCQKEILIFIASMILFIGWAIAGFISGLLADRFGRKNVLFISLLLSTLSTFISGFSINIWMYINCRFWTGAFSAGALAQGYVLLNEFIVEKKRPLVAMILCNNATIALLILGLRAYFITKWKLLTITSAVPTFIFTLVFYRFVPESFRWQRVNKRYEACIKTLKSVGKFNRINDDLIDYSIVYEEERTSGTSHLKQIFWPVRNLCRTSFLWHGWLTCGLMFSAISMVTGYLGGTMHRDFVLSNLVAIPGAILMMGMSKLFGRKLSFCGCLICASFLFVSLALAAPIPVNWSLRIFLGMTGRMLIVASLVSIFLWTIEMHPTTNRATCLGLMQAPFSFGMASFPFLLKTFSVYHPSAPFLIISAMGVSAIFLLCWLQETKGKALADFATNRREKSKDEVPMKKNSSNDSVEENGNEFEAEKDEERQKLTNSMHDGLAEI